MVSVETITPFSSVETWKDKTWNLANTQNGQKQRLENGIYVEQY